MNHSKGRPRGGLFFVFITGSKRTQAQVYPPKRDVLRGVSSKHLPAKNFNHVAVFPDRSVEVSLPISYSVCRVVEAGRGLCHCAGGTPMPAAETNKYVFQRQKRAVAIHRDGDDFVASLMPNDLVIFRNESADALRKVCKGLRWAVVCDTATATI